MKPPRKKEKRIWRVVLFQEHPAESAFFFWLFSSLLLTFIAIISLSQIQSLDIWWHLKTGAWISQQHSIPKWDPFSFSAAGKLWISHEWLFGWLSYVVYQIGGIPALIGAKVALIAALFFLGAWTARARGALPDALFLVLIVAYYISRGRFMERPELISLPLALGFILLFISSDKRPWIILLAPGLEFLWANTHGGTAVLGWGLSGAFLSDHLWRFRNQKIPLCERIKNKQLLLPLLSFAGVVLASFLNPHGYKAIFYGLLRAESPLNNKEFQSMATMTSQGTDLLIILLYIAIAALLFLFAVLRPKDVRIYEWIIFWHCSCSQSSSLGSGTFSFCFRRPHYPCNLAG